MRGCDGVWRWLVVTGVSVLVGSAAAQERVFRSDDLAAALATARSQQRPVLLFARPTSPGSPALEEIIARSTALGQLISRRTVPVGINFDAEADWAQRYRLRHAPALLLLAPDGSEQDYLFPYREPRDLTNELYEALRGVDAVERARARLKLVRKTDAAPWPLEEQLGYALFRQRRYADALEPLLRCVREGLRDRHYAALRRRALLKTVERVLAEYPPGEQPLRAIVAKWQQVLLKSPHDVNLARNLAVALRVLDAERELLVVFDRLRERTPARRILFDRVLPQLVAAQRYDDVAAVIDPVADFQQRLADARRQHHGRARLRGDVLTHAAMLLEVAAGLGRDEAARQLVELVPAEAVKAEGRATLAAALRRAGRGDLIDALLGGGLSAE